MATDTAGETTPAHPDFPDQEILDFAVSKEILKVVLERPSHPLPLGHVNAENSYFLPSTGTKGFALVLNIIQFDKDPYRTGSSTDVNYLSDLLTQLDYKLYPESKEEREMPRKSKQEIKNFIQEFITRCNEEQPKSAFVFLGSHGIHANLIFTSDSKSLDLYRDIVNAFSHEKCPGLKRKPKMFFVQACQVYPDPDVRKETSTLPGDSQEDPENLKVTVEEMGERLADTEIIQIDSKDNRLRRPTIEDVLICTAAMPGQGAQRHPHKGSLFPYCLTYIMMRYALKLRSLQNMLEMVDKMLEKIKAVGAVVQVPVVTRLKFKTLYFSEVPTGAHEENIKKYNKLPPGIQEFSAGVESNSKWTVISTVSSHTTCGKIRDNMENYRFVEWVEFLLSFSERCQTDKNVLEIVTNCSMMNLQRLNKVDLGEISTRKVVLVICEDEQKVNDLIGKLAPWKSKMDLSVDDLAWEDLTLAHQDKVNEKLKTDFRIELENGKLKGKLLADLITGEEINLFKDTLPEKLSYYVGRTVLTRNIISNNIFNRDASCPDIFVISGVDRYLLSSLVKNEMTGRSTDYLRGRSQAKFLALDNESPAHLERIFKYCSVPIHLLHYAEGRLRWRKSKGELAVLQKYVDNESQDELKEAEFCSCLASDSTLPICISDGPGMGKSVLLAECGRKLSQLFPERLVFYVALREIMEQFKRLKLENNSVNAGAVRKILKETACENIIGEAVLMFKLKCKDQVEIELLLDGLDEVDTSDAKTMLAFMNVIRTSFKSTRIWVTSRPHLLWELENDLKVLGYNIQPFREEDQIQFLTTFWLQERAELEEEKIQRFARHCLKSLKDKMNAVDQDIAGIPLLCLLIGEVYEDVAMEFVEVDKSSASNSHIEICSVTKLYEKMIDNRMVKYKTLFGQSKPTEDSKQNQPGLFSKLLQMCIWRRFQRSSKSSPEEDHLSEQKLKEMHAGLALAEIFPAYLEKLKGLIVPAEMDDILRVGIVAVSNSTRCPKFIHRTFAEYFVAWWLRDKLTRNEEWPEELIMFFFGSALARQTRMGYTFPHYRAPRPEHHENYFFREPTLVGYSFSKPVLCYFLNSMLNDSILKEFPGEVTNSLSGSGVSGDTMNEIAGACICSDFVNIFKLFVESNVFALFHVDIFNLPVLLKAVEKSSLELIHVIISHLEQSSLSSSNSWKDDALKIAVHRGEFCIVEFLIKEKGLRQIVEGLGESGRDIELMFWLLLNSKSNSDSIIKQKLQVLRMLAAINPGLLKAKGDLGESPLLLGLRDRVGANVELLLELMSLGADVLARNQSDQTILHLGEGRNHLSKMDYDRLLMRIPTDKLRILGQLRNKDGETPLMTLVSFMDPEPDTLEIFWATGSDFNCINNDGYSALGLAIKEGRCKLTIVKLLRLGADPTWKGKKGENMIHVAAEYGHVEAVKILVDEYALDPTAMDEEGLTPLDYVIKSDCNCGMRYDTGLAIRQRGGKLKEGYHWLHVAAQEGNPDSVKLLLRLGVDVNGLDCQGNTPLHLAFTKKLNLEEFEKYEDHIDIARHLIENGANPNVLNVLGETALHAGLKGNDLTTNGFRLLWAKTHITGMSSSCATLALQFVVLEAINLVKDKELELEKWARQSKMPRLMILTDPVNDYADEDENPSEWELRTVPEKALRYLIEEKGADVKLRFTSRKETLLHKAAIGKNKDVNLKIIKYLIERGVEVDAIDSQNQTFLHTYISRFEAPSPTNFHNLVEFLLTRDSFYSSLFHIPAVEGGVTPLHLAMCYLEPLEETLELLHSNGVNFNDNDKDGNSLFAYGIMGEQRKELLAFLITHGADHKYINTGTKCNMLHIAVEAGNLEALKFLREVGGVNVNEVDGNGCTPLTIALRTGGGMTIAEWLIQNGAVALRARDPTFKSKSKAKNMNMRRNRLSNIHAFNPFWHDLE